MPQTVTPYLLYEDAEAAVEFLASPLPFGRRSSTCDDPQGHEWSERELERFEREHPRSRG